MIYLDHAATTPLHPQAAQALRAWLDQPGAQANPASDHAAGRELRARIEQARAQVAALIGAQPEELLFTSGATEANNLALKGALEFRGRSGAHLVTSRIEHRCVLDSARWLETQGVRVSYLRPDARGRIDPAAVLAELRPETVLVSLMWVQNELGSCLPIERLAPRLRERGVLLHVDAAQAAGKLAIDLARTPVDLLSLSAHKLGGPPGIGALFVRKRPRARLSPQLHGGGQEQGMRSGTLPAPLILAFGAAAAAAAAEQPALAARLETLRERLWQGLRAGIPDLTRNTPPAGEAAPQLLNVSVPGVEGESLRARLPALALSSGAACSSATREPSYVLRALGHDDALAEASLRYSLGRDTTAAEIDQAIQLTVAAVQALRDIARGVPPAALAATDPRYPSPVWQRFCAPTRVGAVAAAPEQHEIGTRAGRDRLWLGVWRDASGRVQQACFQALGSPYTIALGQWLCESLSAASGPLQPSAAIIRAALEIPEERAHCALMGEEALLALSPPVIPA
ncbi:MAG TPA: cysteine desulfurase family protein [Nevskiaceae bacterium]|nr:cysteine desulfurase family protein [Nevskiaceae bacterium]